MARLFWGRSKALLICSFMSGSEEFAVMVVAKTRVPRHLPPLLCAQGATNIEQPDSKRKRVDNAENEDSESRPNELRIMETRIRKLMPLHKSLACPYFKKASRCCGFGFTKISYMKAHIYRKPAIPIYCPVYQQTFENVQLRDTHNRERNCEPIKDSHAPNGITPEQRDWLHQRGPRKFSEEQQWFRIFEFLFPT